MIVFLVDFGGCQTSPSALRISSRKIGPCMWIGAATIMLSAKLTRCVYRSISCVLPDLTGIGNDAQLSIMLKHYDTLYCVVNL